MERLICENCFAMAPTGSSTCPECGEPMTPEGSQAQDNLSKDRLLDIHATVYSQMDRFMVRVRLALLVPYWICNSPAFARMQTALRESTQKDPLMSSKERGPQLVEQFKEALVSTWSKAAAAFHTTGDEIEKTTDGFREQEDQDVISAVARLEAIERDKTAGIVNEDEVPADLTHEKVLLVYRNPLCAYEFDRPFDLIVHRDHARVDGDAECGH